MRTTSSSIAQRLKSLAARAKRDGVTLWFASRHATTPWYVKALTVVVVAYALSPIDLIPDFIPVIGYLDDLLLLPALIWLAIRMIPPTTLAECRALADEWMQQRRAKPVSRWGAALIVLVWLLIGAALWLWFATA